VSSRTIASHATSTLAVAAVALLVTAVDAQCDDGKLFASDHDTNDRFGLSVSIDGDRLLAGSADKLTGSVPRGAAYVFARSAGDWSEEAKLLASDADVDDEFGHAVLLVGDEAFVGNPRDNVGTSADIGSVYVFRRDLSGWNETQKLLPSDGFFQHGFGFSVASDGQHLLVGALQAPLGDYTGRAYFYESTGGTWGGEQIVVASDFAKGDRFGWAVELEGEWAFVAAPKDGDLGEQSGAVYVFRDVGGSWTEVQKLLPSDGGFGWGFGLGMDLDGDTLVVSAAGQPQALYVFRRQGDSWVEEAKLVGADGGVPGFASPVAVSGDLLACIGSNEFANVVMAFERQGGAWELRSKRTSSDHLPADMFGNALAMSGDEILSGAFHKDVGHAVKAGAVYIFDATVQPACMVGDRVESPAPFVGQSLVFFAGPEQAGQTYLLLGSLSGTTPGVTIGAAHIPLNLDAYGNYSVLHPNSDPLFNSLGGLDASGTTSMMHFAPSIGVSSLIGTTVHHACVILEPFGIEVISNPVSLLITP